MAKKNVKKLKEDEFERKVFVGGLSAVTTEKDLENYFSKFGRIEDILINRSCESGGCRGCAFVLFHEVKVAKQLIDDPSRHRIANHMVEVKCCHRKKPKPERNQIKKKFIEAKKASENPESLVASYPAQQLYPV